MSSSPFSVTPTQQSHGKRELLCRTVPYDQLLLDGTGFDPTRVACVELAPGDELYRLFTEHICEASATRSFALGVGRGRKGCCGSDDDDDDAVGRTAHKSLGLGVFPFEHEGKRFAALHQTLGEPVGSDCGATILRSLVLCADNIDDITALADELLAKADKTDGRKFTIYRWHCDYQYWRREETATARLLDSVVLPRKTKDTLVNDLDDFVSAGTRKWYENHGIPYKRSYLLFGAPGAGKTSLVQALAGRYKRSLAILTPSHPKMDDDGLKAAVQRVPPKSIIVLEDVDAIFADGRTKKDGDKSCVTFSGVLNALDGVGGCAGQIFVLTTNHREKLDPALIRCGRVDMHIEFEDAKREQMELMFRQFYPSAPASLAEDFAGGLAKLLGDNTVSCAQLQHFFIQMRKVPAAEAATLFAKVIEEAEAHGKIKREKEAVDKEKEEQKTAEGKQKKNGTKAKKKEAGEEEDESEEEEEEKSEEEGSKSKKCGKGSKGRKGDTHVHVHMH